MKDFKNGEIVTETYYKLVYDDGGWNGFSFDCDKNGKITNTNEAALKNYEWAKQHADTFVRAGKVIKESYSYRENNSGICDCGNRIELYNEYLGGCECPHCGRWWNVWGQRLNNPETWSNGEDW